MIDVVDRIPNFPNRKKITPENGTAYYATVEYADDPVVAGTPINKALFQKISAITHGSYVGTGACGSTNPNTLTFDFEPKFVFILGRGGYKYNGLEYNVQTLMVHGSTNANSFGFAADYAPSTSGRGYDGGLTVSWGNNSVSWYLNQVSNASDSLSNTLQLNVANVTYYYVAMG